MCSGTTLKFLCYFYACCNFFCAISIAVEADKVSEKIMRDNCSVNLVPDGSSRVSQEICNKFTYALLIFMLSLGCLMSVLLVVGVALDKRQLIKAFRIFLLINITFLLACWLAIFLSFYETQSFVLMFLWGFVLVLVIVYFGMQIWIVSGAYDAICKKSYNIQDVIKRESINLFKMDNATKIQNISEFV